MPRHPPRALSSFDHHSITVTTRGWDPSGHLSIRLLKCVAPRDVLMLTKNRPDAGRLALGHQSELVSLCRDSSLPKSKCVSVRGLLSIDFGGGFVGGAGGTRTPDPLLAKEVLSQLSYGPTISGVRCELSGASEVVGDGGLEPPTSVLSGPRSNRLS